MKKRLGRKARHALAAIFAALSFAVGCVSAGTEPIGGETHFLQRCAPGTDSCGPALTCLEGACTAPCDEDTGCDDLTAAQCLPLSPLDTASAGSAKRCDVPCDADADCAVLSPAHLCEAGRCRAPELPSSGGGGADGSCVLESVSGSQVLVLGDSFFAATHQTTAYLEDLARARGRLSVGERFRDASRLTENALALTGNGIADQYATAVAESDARVVVMDGGGADVLLGSCETVDADCPLLADAASAAQSLFSTMADDGVALVVYAFYPDYSDLVREELDVLRPMAEQACASSAVPCLWVDLRDAFQGHEADYLQSDGLNPSSAGSQATAQAIWAALESSCSVP